MVRNAIVNADAEVHDVIEHLESASAMLVDMDDDATKVYLQCFLPLGKTRGILIIMFCK